VTETRFQVDGFIGKKNVEQAFLRVCVREQPLTPAAADDPPGIADAVEFGAHFKLLRDCNGRG